MKCSVLGFFAVVLAWGQTFDVTLNGLVTDPDDGVVMETAVRATSTQTGFTRSTMTDKGGRFTLLNLPAGTYEIEVSKPGFARQVRSDQVFFVGTTITLYFTLQLATAGESVTVSGGAPVIETSKNVLAHTIGFSEIDKLPVIGRSFTDLAALSPGVVRIANNAVAISGNRYYQTGYQVDGVSSGKRYDGTQRVQYAQDWIQEFQVMTSQFSAEFGQAEGGVLNAITRSGTNTMHGRMYSFLRSDAWQAKPEFTTINPPLDEKRIGATLGGPLRKDRLFYFLGYEWFNNQSSNIVTTPFTALNGPVPTESLQQLALGKLDYHPAERHTVRLRYNTQKYDDVNTTAGGRITQEFAGPTAIRASDYIANWTLLLSPRSLNDARLSYNDRITRNGCNFAGSHPPGTWFSRIYGNAILGCPQTFGSTGENQVQFIDNYSRTSGSHELKAGLQVYRNRTYSDFIQNGSYTFPGGASFPFTLADTNSYPIAFGLVEGGTRWTVSSWSYGFFVQDSWRLRPNFTLNFGLRYDLDGSLTALNPLVRPGTGFHGTDLDVNNVAPRAGFAWTPFRDHRRTVVRAGAGLYYDQQHDLTAAGFLQFGLLYDRSLNINANNALLNPFSDAASARRFLAEALAANRIPDVSRLPTPPSSVAQLDQGLAVPYSAQISTGLGHEVSRGLSLSADYVYSRGLDQFIGRDVNLDPVTLKPINPKYTQNFGYGNAGYTRYHGLQTRVTWTADPHSLLKLAYTLASVRSNTGTTLNGPPATNPFDYSEDEGPNDNDVRNVLNLSGSRSLPWGIQASGILSYSSAFPYSAISSAPRPDGRPFGWRPEPRNSRRGDSFVSLDIRAGKTFYFTERTGATGFVEVFNLTNAVNYSSFVANIAASNFGQPTLAGPKRRMQLGFRLDF